MLSPSSLSPSARAAFATESRLLSCFVTESLLKAVFLPCRQEHLVGAALVLSFSASKRDSAPYSLADIFAVIPLRHVPIFRSGTQFEIGLLDPLDMLPYVYKLCGDTTYTNGDADPATKVRFIPALQIPGSAALLSRHSGVFEPNLWKITFLAPLTEIKQPDALRKAILPALSYAIPNISNAALIPYASPLHLWKRFADGFNISDDMQDAVAEELSSSLAWQRSYLHRTACTRSKSLSRRTCL